MVAASDRAGALAEDREGPTLVVPVVFLVLSVTVLFAAGSQGATQPRRLRFPARSGSICGTRAARSAIVDQDR